MNILIIIATESYRLSAFVKRLFFKKSLSQSGFKEEYSNYHAKIQPPNSLRKETITMVDWVVNCTTFFLLSTEL